ncbi:hypothetical protein C5167_018777 [Papaver somniferum]|uniref:Uncharacterized protein n=1 Tax=Papaver somniferum TaxID=3469 RepID=A0A4Y7ISE3_PAPSO|nr:hypothetical protein C5167_018777 [Papaver somniferum]
MLECCVCLKDWWTTEFIIIYYIPYVMLHSLYLRTLQEIMLDQCNVIIIVHFCISSC